MGDLEYFLVDKLGRPVVTEIPYPVFRRNGLSDIQLRMYCELKQLFKIKPRTMRIDGKTRSLKRGQALFQVKVFSREHGYSSTIVRREFRQMNHLGFWDVEKYRDGTLVTERPIYEINQLKALQVRRLVRRRPELSIEENKRIMIREYAAWISENPELAPEIAAINHDFLPEITGTSRSAENTSNAVSESQIGPVHLNQIPLPSQNVVMQGENSPASAGPLPSGPSDAEENAPQALENRDQEPSALKCDPSGLPSGRVPPEDGEGASSAAIEGEENSGGEMRHPVIDSKFTPEEIEKMRPWLKRKISSLNLESAHA